MTPNSRQAKLAAYNTVAIHGGVASSDPHAMVMMLLDAAAERMTAACGCIEHKKLVRKSKLALERGGYRSFGLSGGVANNRTLQALLGQLAQQQGLPFYHAQLQHTGDNAGMIAFAAWAEREPGGVHDAGLRLEIAPSLPLAAG